ncbi:hypothetical protein T492DRAFT_428525 [Pavlovales sp. CCMP2436]|nr:hypothetical protein T492DRAFT_428525 [Pavlovales sp. CCMP2436]
MAGRVDTGERTPALSRAEAALARDASAHGTALLVEAVRAEHDGRVHALLRDAFEARGASVRADERLRAAEARTAELNLVLAAGVHDAAEARLEAELRADELAHRLRASERARRSAEVGLRSAEVGLRSAEAGLGSASRAAELLQHANERLRRELALALLRPTSELGKRGGPESRARSAPRGGSAPRARSAPRGTAAEIPAQTGGGRAGTGFAIHSSRVAALALPRPRCVRPGTLASRGAKDTYPLPVVDAETEGRARARRRSSARDWAPRLPDSFGRPDSIRHTRRGASPRGASPEPAPLAGWAASLPAPNERVPGQPTSSLLSANADVAVVADANAAELTIAAAVTVAAAAAAAAATASAATAAAAAATATAAAATRPTPTLADLGGLSAPASPATPVRRCVCVCVCVVCVCVCRGGGGGRGLIAYRMRALHC